MYSAFVQMLSCSILKSLEANCEATSSLKLHSMQNSLATFLHKLANSLVNSKNTQTPASSQYNALKLFSEIRHKSKQRVTNRLSPSM